MNDLISKQEVLNDLSEPFVMSQCLTVEECKTMNRARELCLARVERIESAQRWIPVTEKLPEDRHDVLVYAGIMFSYITVGYYDGLWKFSYNDEEIAGSADYWMPLPEPPKEEP